MRFSLILVGGLCLWGESVADDAVAYQMKRGDPDVHRVHVLKREAVGGDLDLVVAFGLPKQRVDRVMGRVSWDKQTQIGLFLQGREDAGKIYRIAVERGMGDGECFARVERVSVSDVVIGCIPEKVGQGIHRKFVYDARAKALVTFFDYPEFTMERLRAAGDKVILEGRDGSIKVAMTLGADGVWGAKAAGSANPWPLAKRVLRFGSSMEFQVTEDTAEVIEHKNGKRFRLKRILGEEQIGPWQVEGTKLWFGKTFYDGEGMTGEGGLGYFDWVKRSFEMYSPEAVKRASVSALLLEPERIWLGLVHLGEYGPSSMGVVEIGRSTQETRRIEVPGVVHGIVRAGEKIVMATEFGAAVWEGQLLRRFFIDMTSDGRMRVVEGIAVP